MADVSVVTIVRDGEPFIADAVRSVQMDALDAPGITTEHVVVDDGSSDGTRRVLDALVPEVPHLRVESIPPSGVPVARNRALALARGDYVAVLDADDVQLPGRLRHQVRFLEEHPDHGMVGGQELAFDVATGLARVVRHPVSDREIRRRWLRAHVFTHSSVMMRAATLEAVGTFDEARVHGDEDMDLWIRIARHTRVANLDRLVVLRRYHPLQITRTRPLRDLQIKLSMKSRAVRDLGLPPTRYLQLVWPLFSVLPTSGKRFIRRLSGEHSPGGPLSDFLDEEVLGRLPESVTGP